MPLDKGVDVQVARCISLIEGNRGAARTFYQYAQRHMTLDDVGESELAVELIILTSRLPVEGKINQIILYFKLTTHCSNPYKLQMHGLRNDS